MYKDLVTSSIVFCRFHEHRMKLAVQGLCENSVHSAVQIT